MTQRNPYRGNEPKTVGQLYDLLHAWFGMGTYDWGDGKTTWQKARIAEIAKIKRLAAERRKSVRQMHIAALYCREHRKQVRSAYMLFTHMDDALAWDRRCSEEEEMASVAEQIADAVEWELENHPGEAKWVDQLLRAQKDEDRKDVLNRWRLGRRQFTRN